MVLNPVKVEATVNLKEISFFDELSKKGINSDIIIELCRLMKYIGDKSHIICSIVLFLATQKPQIILTIDRLLFKSIVQVIEKARVLGQTENIYKQLSQNLGCILGRTNGDCPNVLKETNSFVDYIYNIDYNYLCLYFVQSPVAFETAWLKKIKQFTEIDIPIPDSDEDIIAIYNKVRMDQQIANIFYVKKRNL